MQKCKLKANKFRFYCPSSSLLTDNLTIVLFNNSRQDDKGLAFLGNAIHLSYFGSD